MTSDPTPLDHAAQAFREAEKAMHEAKEARDAALYDVIKLCPGELNPDGSANFESDYFNIVVTGKMTRTLTRSGSSLFNSRCAPATSTPC